MKVMVGGTFDRLHIGHRNLLTQAFTCAGFDGFVYIGLSSDVFAQRKEGLVHSYEERKRNLIQWITNTGFTASYCIEPLNDPFGTTLSADADILVVSFETAKVGKLINKKREERGLKPMQLLQIPTVLGPDGKIVSSTRIRKKEIDSYGIPLSSYHPPSP